MKAVALIAGAGPAGLTAALELLRRSDVTPVVIEADSQVGGISKTINYRGNRMDIGGHRFFSKSDWVMRWWQEILPVADPGDGANNTADATATAGAGTAGATTATAAAAAALRLHYQGQSRDWVPERRSSPDTDAVMLVRRRLSRIYYRRRFFDYPLTLNAATLRNLGIPEALKIGLSYAAAQVNARPEVTLEDFLVNRFGRRLYETFFEDYTRKVWGVPCRDIAAEWGAQRIKGLSVAKALAHALAKPFRQPSNTAQQGTETSLIERFLYPKYGPGQMWEEVARRVTAQGGTIHLGTRVTRVHQLDNRISAVEVTDAAGAVRRITCDHLISTMPVKDLIGMLQPDDASLARNAAALPYRDFMTAGLSLRNMRGRSAPPDNWIYIQEPNVRIGRLQIFNNWSPALVADPDTVWLGLEYFCAAGDDLWSMHDDQFLRFAADEMRTIGLIDGNEVLDGTVVRVPKAYPAYFGTYSRFDEMRSYLDRYPNLYPIGRNGMHRYNNQDHSMLTAKAAVEAIAGRASKAAIWDINGDDSYHEERVEERVPVGAAS